MAKRQIGERKAKKLSQIQKLKEEVIKLERLAAEHLGRVAVKARLGDLGLTDEQLLKEFQAVGSRFRGDAEK